MNKKRDRKGKEIVILWILEMSGKDTIS